jgi:hypothetical protein
MAVSGSPVAAESAPLLENIGYQNNGYIGIGSAIGLGGNTTALGTGGVAILTKVRFSDSFSLHDATILFGGGAATSMVIVSADFPIRNDAGQTIVDIPVSKNFTGTVRVNAGFPDRRQVDVGILAGIGYNFGS